MKSSDITTRRVQTHKTRNGRLHFKDPFLWSSFNLKLEQYSPAEAVVIFLCSPEANDRVSDCGSIDGREAGHDRQDHSILHAVVA